MGPSPLRSPAHVRSLNPLRGLVGGSGAAAGAGARSADIDPTPVPTPQRSAYPFPVRPLASGHGPGARLPGGDAAAFSTPASAHAPYVQPHFTPSRGTSPARPASASPPRALHTPRATNAGRGQSDESKDEQKLTEALLSTRATLGRALTAVKEAMDRQAHEPPPQVAEAVPERVPEVAPESVSPPPDPPAQPFESSITDLLRMTAGLGSPTAARELQRRVGPAGGLSGSRFRTVGISPPSSPEDEGAAAPTTAAARVALYRSLINGGVGRPVGRPTEAIIRAARDKAAELLEGLGKRAPPPTPPALAAPAPLPASLHVALASPLGGNFGTLQTGVEGAEGGAIPPPPTPGRQDKPRGRTGRTSREDAGTGTPGRLFMVTVPHSASDEGSDAGPAGIPVFVKGSGVVLMRASMLAAMGVRVDSSQEAAVVVASRNVHG